MSEKEIEDFRDIIIHSQKIIAEAEQARKSLHNWIKIMIVAILGAISVVSVLIVKVDQNKDSIKFLSKDYTPLWTLQALQSNNDYMVQEIAATFGATEPDKAKIKDIQKKYADFQKWVVNNIAQQRSGISTIIRGADPGIKPDSQ